MKRYGKYSEKYETIINGTGLPAKKKRIRRLLLTTCNKSLPCVQPPPLPANKTGERDRLSDFRDIFFKIPRLRRQRERQKNNMLNRQKNNFASA